MTQTIDDLVILGRSSPETLEDGRATVCVGGWSNSRGYVRLYPTRLDMNETLKRWNVVSVEVQDDPSHDNRNESFKIAGSQDEWDSLHEKIDVVGAWDKPKQREFVRSIPKICTRKLNDLRYSLGIVKPMVLEHEISPPAGDDEKPGLSKKNRKTLHIKYECGDDCGNKQGFHRQHCIEWGMYEFWRKNGGDYPDDEVVNIFNLYSDDHDVYFLMGNLQHRRSAYVIISVLRFKREPSVDNTGLDDFVSGDE